MDGQPERGWGAELLRCPVCLATLGPVEQGLHCADCGTTWPCDEVAVTFVHREGRHRTLALGERAMQSSWLAAVYDHWWRPLAFRAFGAWRLPHFEREVELVLDRLGSARGPWLDLSCGTGRVLERLCHAAPRGRVVGLDLSRGMLEQARRRAPGAVLVRANAERLPLASGSFGAVINLAALDLYRDGRRAVAEAARVLVPGGRWVATAFVSPAFLVQGRAIRGGLASVTGIHAMTSRCLQDWVKLAGLVRYDERRWGNYLLAWAEKPKTRAGTT